MLNILVTGAKGFIGKNLVKRLNIRRDIRVLSFNRSDSMETLEKQLLETDFIIHLAGEVRPTSSEEEFYQSNTSLTASIISILEKNNKVTPILLASTIHAKLLKNEYGKSKRASELIVEKYSLKYLSSCIIYQLPHVFGEGCKPNYNSVITTWIHNSINNLEINVFDRDIKMNYIYVQDIVEELITFIIKKNNSLYIEPLLSYETTLGEVVDFIEEFKVNIENTTYFISDNNFKEKMFNTYKYYYRESNAK